MKILLVYPRYPDTFWSFRYAMKFIDRKASFPPLGLLTVAAMLPGEWEKRLVDMNVQSLSDEALEWADYVFISAMTVQRKSALEVIARCRRLGVKTVAGGPLFSAYREDFPEVDHLVLGEAEITFPPFLEDLQKGEPRHLYADHRRADLRTTPIPLWELIDVRKYAAMNIQYSRGCPFDCEFCQSGYIGALFKSILFLGVVGRERLHFWKLFFWSLARRPRLFPLAITYAVYGFHFRKVAENIMWDEM